MARSVAMERRETLSLNEWAVLVCLVERPRHGYDIAAALAPDAELGAVWRVPRQLVYRALDRLAALGLAEPRRAEPGEGGPPRQVFGATEGGRARVVAWVHEPVAHLRDVRGGLLLKLVAARRLAVEVAPLIAAQRARFTPALSALSEPPPASDPVGLWRYHSAAAVRAFLDDLDDLR